MVTRWRHADERRAQARRVLVVDEHHDLRTIICDRIHQLGFGCESVETGEDALRALERFRPQIALVEWDLTDGSGRGLATKMREWSEHHQHPLALIAMHGARDSDAHRTTEAYDLYVGKLQLVPELEHVLHRFTAAN